MMQRELEHLRRRCSELTEEKTRIRLIIMLYKIVIDIVYFRNELASAQRLLHGKDKEITQIRLINIADVVDIDFEYKYVK